MLVLRYNHHIEGLCESLFTLNERETALALARQMFKRGQRPSLMSKTYNGKFVVLFDWSQQRRRAA